jgi:Tol biopolymer transport system component
MASNRDDQIRALYRAALERPAEERAAFVAAQTGSDPELRSSVEALLSQRDATDMGSDAVDSDAAEEFPLGTQIGSYRIDAVLGRGGMGVVYRATDTKLHRPVAIKFLSAGVADAQARARFRREAETASGLNHPHILTVHDVGEHDGRQYIVSELVDGGTLSDWAMRPRTWRQCVDLLTGVADAIAAAHAAGVLHRDIKPGNILIGANGYAKLADFGLAKLADPGPSGARSTLKTGVGVVIGTTAYMSPEQASGQPLDARSDIFSFGGVLYELLAGQRPFEAATDLEVLKAIVHAPPAPLPSTVPEALRTIVEKTLEKDPAERYQHMQDLVVDLRRVARKASTTSQPAVEAPTTRRRYGWVKDAGWAIVLAVVAVPAALYFLRTTPRAPEMRFEISLPGYVGNLAISPQGDRIAYVALVDGRRQISIRPFDASEAYPLAGTDGASGVFWSADGERLGFYADGKLRRIDAGGGPAQTVADSAILTGLGTWNRDGTILYALSAIDTGGLAVIGRVAQSGGTTSVVTTIDSEREEGAHFLPTFLEDGDRFLYLAAQANTLAVKIGSLSRNTATTLVEIARNPAAGMPYRYGSGHLLYRLDNAIVAQRLDLRSSTLVGPIAPIAAGDARDYSASDNGVLVFTSGPQQAPGAAGRRFTWFNREGDVIGYVDAAPGAINPTLSPDERRVAFNTSVQQPNPDVWIVDLERGAATRRTFDPSGASVPLWSPDGPRFIFNSRRGTSTPNQLFIRASNGSGSEEPLYSGTPGEFLVPLDWYGDHILFQRQHVDSLTQRSDIWALPTTGEKTAFRLFESNSNNNAAKLSPDGRWVAYATNESGVRQIVVRPFPDTSGGLWQVSTSGGMEPHWRGDGKELFYLGLDGMLMAVDVESGEALELGAPRALFSTGIAIPAVPLEHFFDVAADGQRFLVNTIAPETRGEEDPAPTRITVVVNWTSSLAQ